MPNNKKDCPHQQDITNKAAVARKALQKFKDTHPTFDLDLDLQIIDDNLAAIEMDNHKAT